MDLSFGWRSFPFLAILDLGFQFLGSHPSIDELMKSVSEREHLPGRLKSVMDLLNTRIQFRVGFETIQS